MTAASALVVEAGGRVYGLPLAAVVEVCRPLPIEPIAGAPPFVAGVARLRAAHVPVVDLAALVGAAATGAPRRWVTVAVGDRRVALAVDGVRGVRRLEADDLPPLLGETAGVAGLARLDGDLAQVLDAARLLPDDLDVPVPPAGAAAAPEDGGDASGAPEAP